MPMLEVPGAFTMLVPDGWHASQTGRTYELTKDGDDSAAHVSMYERNAGPLEDDEAAGVVATFVRQTGHTETPDIHVLKESKAQHRAVTSFMADLDGKAHAWLVFAVLWRERLLLCSWNGEPGSQTMREAEEMFASIFPPKKGLFRRG